MALDFNKVRASKGGSLDHEGGHRVQQANAGRLSREATSFRHYGRSCAPPPPGSGWMAFLEWASEGNIDHTPEDAALAMRFWLGNDLSGEEESRSPTP